MNKKIFGIRVSTILTFLVCFLCAVLLWVYVSFKNDSTEDNSNKADVSYTEIIDYDLL